MGIKRNQNSCCLSMGFAKTGQFWGSLVIDFGEFGGGTGEAAIFLGKEPRPLYSLNFLLSPSIFLYSLSLSRSIFFSQSFLFSWSPLCVFSFPSLFFMYLDSPPSSFYIWFMVCICVHLSLSLSGMCYVCMYYSLMKNEPICGVYSIYVYQVCCCGGEKENIS